MAFDGIRRIDVRRDPVRGYGSLLDRTGVESAGEARKPSMRGPDEDDESRFIAKSNALMEFADFNCRVYRDFFCLFDCVDLFSMSRRDDSVIFKNGIVSILFRYS
ncbi:MULTISPECIES: hypothetical protein [unclassified Burkholderia]|uniref:hypothetical protein n=1 Tax=unclassified Burkholderia TaxID=2613784 RepID=UPI00114658DF|nr:MULTISPECIES: hypothetical protein [unclassified Burkholderia]